MKNYKKGIVENFQEGEIIVILVCKVFGGKVQVMIGEIVKNFNLGEFCENFVGMFNKSDERFFERIFKFCYVFIIVEFKDFMEFIGIDIEKVIKESNGEINLLNLFIVLFDGK